MLNLPKQVQILEVSTRDGFQMEKNMIPTDVKVEMVNRISRTGIKEIQVTSFVHPKAVPNLADAEEVMARIDRVPGVLYEVLVPNKRGVERAIAAKADKMHLMLSVSDSHSLSNANATTEQALQNLAPAVELAHAAGLPVAGGMATALGCPFEGFPTVERLLWVAGRLWEMGVREFSVADTAGMANPALVYDRLSRLRDRFPEAKLSLHLHDTRRMALANILAALQVGVTHFDTAIGGLGGCPYCPGATGNICTEDVVHMLHQMGIDTGTDLDALIGVAHRMGEVVDHPLDSFLLRAGSKSDDLLGPVVSKQEKLA